MDKNNFLQSKQWLKFQESIGRKTFEIDADDFHAGAIEHKLPIVGNYFYVPRGPFFSCHSERIRQQAEEPKNPETNITSCNSTGSFVSPRTTELIDLAKKENAGWVRIDPENEETLDLIRKSTNYKTVKAPHDMQPKEIFRIAILKSEEELLAEMKSKTRYNIKLAQKQGVFVKVISNQIPNSNDKKNTKYIEEFVRLTREMAKRNGITSHPEEYYRKMIESLPGGMLKLYCAEYGGKIIATNLILFYGDTATYLHGASGNEHRNVMAPFLIQWQAIADAKQRGCTQYDFGGISSTTNHEPRTNNWQGITKFKLGFSPNTEPIVFPGSYDIILNSRKYALYRGLQYIKRFANEIWK